MAFFLAFKEIWRNQVRFLSFSAVIALITVLVLFIAALAQGLAMANKEYLSKVDGDLIVFDKNADLMASSSLIRRSNLNDITRVEGVADAGSVGFSTGKVLLGNSGEFLDVSLIGVDPNKPGAPPVLEGQSFSNNRSSEVIIDANVAEDSGLQVGDKITIVTIRNDEETYNTLPVTGITDGQQYLYAGSVFLTNNTWDKIRSTGAATTGLTELTSNVVIVKGENPDEAELVAQQIENQVSGTDVVDIQTAIEALPGYSAQQSTLNTQQAFTLLIGILVIGGFFQIQMLQKIPQIGVLKAIGTTNSVVAHSVVMQIILITTFGVFIGAGITFLLATFLPAGIPILFSGPSVLLAVISLLLIGPIGGLVSVRLAISVEPLIALRL